MRGLIDFRHGIAHEDHLVIVFDATSNCQSALKFNPLSASNRDPSLALGQACPGSE